MFVGFSKSKSYSLNERLSESNTCCSSFDFALVEDAESELVVFLFLSKNPLRKGGVFQKTKTQAQLNTSESFILRSNSDSHVLTVGETLQAKFRLSPFFMIQSSHSSKIP